jgi:hypothetical protein
VARELLLLCSFLQGVPSRFADRFSDLTCDYRILMSRAFNAATRFVTSDEELTASIEGVECVMLESMYLNNAGNLRRAWLANRRAMLIAQMMGLHTDKTTATIVWLRDETRDRIDKDYMWSRIVFTDRYLSLMLGLPQGSAESVFASPNALNSCGPLERMERMESVAGGLIIQRNETEKTDAAVTNQVDTILQEAAALMPPQWWLVVPHLANLQDGDAKAFEESTRIMFQFTHHHLLVQLHLPYVMLSTGVRHDYSKMTAASASRSIIALFIAFRSSSTSTAYCRGVDFIAFIASTVLCLVHIEARRQGSRDGVSGLQSLQHQRLTDRGMLERTLEIMDNMAITSNDVVAQKIAKILEPLLAVEDDSYTGGCYNIQASTEENVQEPQSLGSITEATHALRIHIPYFGTIRIEHHAPDHGPGKHTKLSTRDQSVLVSREHINRVDEGVSSAATQPVGYEISATQSVNHDWQTVPSFVPQPNEARPHQSISQCSPPPAEEALNAHLLVPGLSVGVDDWVLQGVDMALFSTIVQDTVTSN